MIAQTLLTLAIAGTVGTPGGVWQPCGEVCTYGATCELECEPGLVCAEHDGATLCTPQCKADGQCQDHDPAPPPTSDDAQCWDEVCILPCVSSDDCPEGLKCVDGIGEEGACMGEADYV